MQGDLPPAAGRRRALAIAGPCRQLIVNADDLGICAARDAGILAAFAARAVTSASLLVNGPTAARAAQQAIAAGLPLGLHLNLSEGPPCAPGGTLAGSDGQLRGRYGLRAALAAGSILRDDLVREIRAQFAAFVALTGGHPGHVDGHQHCHVDPRVCAVLAPIMREFGVRHVRLPQEASLAAAAAAGELAADADFDLPFQLAVAGSTGCARTVYAAAGVVSSDAFIGQTLMGYRLQAAAVAGHLARLAAAAGARPVSVELMVHPGVPAAAGEGSAFCRSPARGHELALLESPAWRLVTAGWQSAAWPDLCRSGAAESKTEEGEESEEGPVGPATVLSVGDEVLQLTGAPDSHPVSPENLALFAALALSENARQRWPRTLPGVADIGCGGGVFGLSLLALLAASGHCVGRLLFTDPHAASLSALEKTLARQRLRLPMLEVAEFDTGSLLAPLIERGEHVQALCFNLPQTPGPAGFRLDRSGGADGAELICQLLADLPQVLDDEGEAFMLHISLAHPARVARTLAGIGFVAEVLAAQQRHAGFADYDALQPGLASYLRAEQAAGRAEFTPDPEGAGFYFTARLLRLRRS